jgi:rhodanese-related sulfurtransferase
MAKLTVYVDSGVRSSAARTYLKNLGVTFDEVNITVNEDAMAFLNQQQRPVGKFNMPQFYVGNKLVWANGFKDLSGLTAEQINEKVEEINAAN